MSLALDRRVAVGAYMLGAVAFAASGVALYVAMPQDARGSMNVYLGSLLASLLLASLQQLVERRKVRRAFLVLAVAVLALPMALRAQTGIDDVAYLRMFLRVSNTDFLGYLRTSGTDAVGNTVEVGYLALNYVLYRLTGGDYNIAQCTITLATFAFFAAAMAKEGGDEGLPLQLLLLWSNYYFTMMDGGLVRIFLASSIVYLALTFIFEGNARAFIGLVVLAALFHVSALVMLIVLPLGRMRELESRWGTYVLAIAALMPILFLVVARFLVPILGSRYSGYSNVSALSLSISSFDTVPLFALCAMRLGSSKEQAAPRSLYVCLVLMALSTVISVCSSIVSLGRLVYFTNLSIVYLCPRASLRFDGSAFDFFMPALMVIYAFAYVSFTRFLGAPIPGTLFPYTSFI